MEIVLMNKNFLVILCFKLFIKLEICIDFQNCIIFDTQNYKELNYHTMIQTLLKNLLHNIPQAFNRSVLASKKNLLV